jgi:hypothetical protein
METAGLTIIIICSIGAIYFSVKGWFIGLNNEKNRLLQRNCELVDKVNTVEKELQTTVDWIINAQIESFQKHGTPVKMPRVILFSVDLPHNVEFQPVDASKIQIKVIEKAIKPNNYETR